MNISATLTAVKLMIKPALFIPHATTPTFDRLPVPISEILAAANGGGTRPDIKAVVLDKDNCFAVPKENVVYAPYKDHLQALRKAFPGPLLLIVSNSAGTDGDVDGREAELLEEATGIKVLRHSTKKPGCGQQVLDYFFEKRELGITKPSHIAVVGDRLFTDVVMANQMGAWSIWVRDGVVINSGPFARLEKAMPPFLGRVGFKAPRP